VGALGAAFAGLATVFLRAAAAAAFVLVDFFDTFFPVLEVTFREEVFVAVTFLRDACFPADLRLDAVVLRPAVRLADFRDAFLRDADLAVDAAVLDLPGLTFRFLPVALLLAEALRDAFFFPVAPAAFRVLLAAFLAGM
jgi:hypothetical protein